MTTTLVHFDMAYRLPDADTVVGTLTFSPALRESEGGQTIIPSSTTVRYEGAPVDVLLEDLGAGNAWEVHEDLGGVQHDRLIRPAVGVPNYADLPEIDRATLDPAAEVIPVYQASIDAAQAAADDAQADATAALSEIGGRLSSANLLIVDSQDIAGGDYTPGMTRQQAVDARIADAFEGYVPGTSLLKAERTTQFGTTATVAGVASNITGLGGPVVGKGRDVWVDLILAGVWHSVANTGVVCYVAVDGLITTGKGSLIQAVQSPINNGGPPLVWRRSLFLADGVTYNFQAGLYGAAGTKTMQGQTYSPSILAVTAA